ncbi:hypothetical protein CANINC_000553 [Pichia inconspicua]|uniref:CDC45-like protein n=1 Tax=Pichia inconspicua TaxID=52247 RepID=A0A4T0X7S8_9ASCO|nr:hypothetical protein CANINC_000553 [[Candida] inconspicua]
MIVTQPQFYKEFKKICKQSLTYSTCKLAIFVSCFNVDAICSSKMLSEYLKRQFIVFQLVPVIGYIDLKERFMNLDADISNVIFIGCGATTDLESYLEIDLANYLDDDMTPEEAETLINSGRLEEVKLTRKIYVIDGQRPWNLDNLYGSPMICCLDDYSTAELDSEKEAFYYLINVSEDDEYAENEESSEEEEVEELAESESDDDEELDLEDSLDRKRVRALKKEPKESRRKKQKRLINEYQEILESYYQQGSTISVPSSHQTYDVLSALGEMNIDYLWLAIIGARSLRNIYRKVYDIVYPGLKAEIKRIQSEENSYMLRTSSESKSVNGSKFSFNVAEKADNLGLQTAREYNLFLLHHWTLYDSFFYSNYVNSKCQLYSNEGTRILKIMFARMGIPLIQANQKWHYLDLELKKNLDSLIEREAAKIGLREIIIEGFKRNYGFHGSISSSDYVESIQALLECNSYEDDMTSEKTLLDNLSQNKQVGKSKHSIEGDDEEADVDDETTVNEEKDRNEQFMKSFWRAYDALNNYDEILRGMEIAKFQQQFIFEKGSEIIQKGMIKTQSKFRIVILNESFTANSSVTRSKNNDSTFNRSASSLKDDRVVDITTFGQGSEMFQNPLILTKLGNWIQNVQADLDEGLLPLLIGAYNVETGTYLICGLPSRAILEDEDDDEDDDDDEKSNGKGARSRDQVSRQKVILNAFSVLFEKVTQEINIQARMDSFQSAIIELKKEDLAKFLNGLTRYSQYML